MNRVAISNAAIVTIALVLARLCMADSLPYHSPYDLAFSPDGRTLAVSDHTAKSVAFIEVEPGGVRLVRQVKLGGQPAGVAWARDGASVFVAEYGAGRVAEVEASSGKVIRRLRAGLRPVGLAVAPARRLLIAANTVTDDVSVIDLATGTERARIEVPREPYFVTVTPDESLAVIGNLLPAGSAEDPTLASVVSLLDLERLQHVSDVRLPAGSTSVREVLTSHRATDVFYTPKLVELYRTAPYLHDGRAATLMDVFTRHGSEKRHGKASLLNKEELEDLVEYLKSR